MSRWLIDAQRALGRRARCGLLAALLLAPASVLAEIPVPPCGVPPQPGYPAVGAAPQARLLRLQVADGAWTLPRCVGWDVAAPAMILGLAGRFAFAGDTDAMLARLGAVSTMRGLRYWSITDKAWRDFITDAAALSEPDAQRRRPDFSVAELRRGDDLFLSQTDSRSLEPVVYRARLREASRTRIVIGFENVTTVHALRLIPIYRPGDIRMTVFLDRIDERSWAYYAMSAVRETPSAAGEASFANRAAAYYRHVAGLAGGPGSPSPVLASENASSASTASTPAPVR